MIPKGIPDRDGKIDDKKSRLRAATRNGSRLEFTETLQFGCYLSKSYTELTNRFSSEDSESAIDITPGDLKFLSSADQGLIPWSR